MLCFELFAFQTIVSGVSSESWQSKEVQTLPPKIFAAMPRRGHLAEGTTQTSPGNADTSFPILHFFLFVVFRPDEMPPDPPAEPTDQLRVHSRSTLLPRGTELFCDH